MAVDENSVAKLANQIVQYETKEKGFFGKAFAFESRDGFWSKLSKGVVIPSNAVMAAVSAFSLAAGPLGPIAAGAAAAAAGVASVAVTRTMMKSVYSDMHDSKETYLGKLAHLLLTGIPAIVVAIVTSPIPVLGLVSRLTVAPLLDIISSKGVGAALGNKEQREQSEQARQLAEKAIQMVPAGGQLIEISATKEKPTSAESAYKNSVTPEEYRLLQDKMRQGANDVSAVTRINVPEAGMGRAS